MSHIIIRPARVADAAGIAAVHVRAWQETYAHLLPAEFLASLDVQKRETGWARIIAEGDTDVYVAQDGDEIIGWATAGAGRETEPVRPRELEGIYVLASAHGTGAGQQLLDVAIGDDPAYLWVADGNPRAEAFYQRNGFTRDGATKVEPIGPVGLPVVRMTR